MLALDTETQTIDEVQAYVLKQVDANRDKPIGVVTMACEEEHVEDDTTVPNVCSAYLVENKLPDTEQTRQVVASLIQNGVF